MIDFHKKQFPQHDSTKTPPLRFDRTSALAPNTGAHLTVFNSALVTLFSVFIKKLIVKPRRALDKAEHPANQRHGTANRPATTSRSLEADDAAEAAAE